MAPVLLTLGAFVFVSQQDKRIYTHNYSYDRTTIAATNLHPPQNGPASTDSATFVPLTTPSIQQQVEAPEPTSDTLEDFERDVSKVLRELRPYRYDPLVPEWFRCRRISFTNYWGLEEWEIHVSRRRYLRYIFGIPKSRLLRRLMPQLCALLVWSAIAVTIGQRRPIPMNRGVHVPLTSLSLVSTFVAALQTIRSNHGLSRLDSARIAQQKMVLYTRDIALVLAAYVFPKNRSICLKAARHLALFGWALKSHLRETDGNDIIDVLLPNPVDAEYLKGARKKPVAILSRLRQMMAHLGQRGAISSTAHRLIEDSLRNLDEVIAASDKLRATPTPPVYAAHLSRLMVFYLVFLPFALLGSSLNGLSAVATTMTVGFAMAGLDEMSSMFELPFRFMPLYQIAKVSMLDVADALCRAPPPLNATASSVESNTVHVPLYWAEKDDPFLPYDGREQRQRAYNK